MISPHAEIYKAKFRPTTALFILTLVISFFVGLSVGYFSWGKKDNAVPVSDPFVYCD